MKILHFLGKKSEIYQCSFPDHKTGTALFDLKGAGEGSLEPFKIKDYLYVHWGPADHLKDFVDFQIENIRFRDSSIITIKLKS